MLGIEEMLGSQPGVKFFVALALGTSLSDDAGAEALGQAKALEQRLWVRPRLQTLEPNDLDHWVSQRLLGHTPQYGWDFPEEIPKKSGKTQKTL